MCLGVSEPTKRLAAQSTAYTLSNRQGEQAFAKESEKKKKMKTRKSLRYMDEFFPRLYIIAKLYQIYIIAKYKASSCCKIEPVIQRCSVKKGLLKLLQNSQENPCAKVSFLIKLQLKKRLWHSCFPVNIARFLKTPSVPAIFDYT